jgi:CBS domain-containing protein
MTAGSPQLAAVPALHETLVADAMHAGVVTCSPHVSLAVVARIMAAHRIHAVVVTDVAIEGGARVVWGVVTDLDVLDALGAGCIAERTAGEVSAAAALLVTPADPLDCAVELMREHRATHVVVVDPWMGRPVGVLSTLDVAEIVARAA